MSELRIDTQLQPSNVSGSVLVTGLNKKPFYLAPGNSGTVLMSNGSGVIFSPIPDNVTDVGVNTNGENTISVFRSVDQANPEIYPMPPFGAKDTFSIRNIIDSPYEIIFNTEKKTFYYYDPNDTTSQDDNNYVLVTVDNKVYKNIYEPRYDSELSNLNISIVDLYTNYNNVLSDITNVNQSITDLNIGYSDLNNGINTIQNDLSIVQNDIDQIKLDLDEVVNVEDIYTKIEQLNFGNPITLNNFITNNNVGSNEKKILSGILSKDIFLDIKNRLDILNTNKFNNSGGFINGNVNIDGSINASTSFSFQGNPFITNTFGANSTSLRSISNTTNQPDGLYIGFANTNSAHTRIYDGTTTNSLELYNATVLTKNINKFLFGNQTDTNYFAQFSGQVEIKSDLFVRGDIIYGNGNSRTYSTSNADVAGYSKSGFYDSYNGLNFPSQGTWYTLINAQHYNSYNGNNHATQISGHFFSQNIYFRNINNNNAQTWREFVTMDMSGYCNTIKSLNVVDIIDTQLYKLKNKSIIYDNGGIWGNIRVIANNDTENGDGIYIGYNNASYSPTRIYDGATDNYIRIYSGIFQSFGFNKFLFGNQTDSEEGFQVSLSSKFKNTVSITGVLRLEENLGMNNNQWMYWKNTSGTDIRFLGLSTVNNFYIGDIDNLIFNSNNYYCANNEHNWFVDGSTKMILNKSGNLGIGTTTPNISAILELNSTNKGLLLPRLTNTQKFNISTPPVGLVIYQLDSTEGIYVYTSDGFWRRLAFSDEVG